MHIGQPGHECCQIVSTVDLENTLHRFQTINEIAQEVKGEPRLLGPKADDKHGIGRVAAICRLGPHGVETIPEVAWKVRRVIEREWTWNNLGSERRLNRADQGAASTGMFNAKPTSTGA